MQSVNSWKSGQEKVTAADLMLFTSFLSSDWLACGCPLAGPEDLAFGELPVLLIDEDVFNACGTAPHHTSLSHKFVKTVWSMVDTCFPSGSGVSVIMAGCRSDKVVRMCLCEQPLYKARTLRLQLTPLGRNTSYALLYFVTRGIVCFEWHLRRGLQNSASHILQTSPDPSL